jgi:hypothetical protein
MTPEPRPEPPPLTEIQPMIYGLIFAWLAQDYWTIARTQEALARSGATAGQIAEVATLAAAALLAGACGSAAKATERAERRWQQDTARQARLIAGQQERAAWAPSSRLGSASRGGRRSARSARGRSRRPR